MQIDLDPNAMPRAVDRIKPDLDLEFKFELNVNQTKNIIRRGKTGAVVPTYRLLCDYCEHLSKTLEIKCTCLEETITLIPISI